MGWLSFSLLYSTRVRADTLGAVAFLLLLLRTRLGAESAPVDGLAEAGFDTAVFDMPANEAPLVRGAVPVAGLVARF